MSGLHGLRTVIYPCRDLRAATDWWRALLGADPYFDEPFYVGFNVAGYELGLISDGDPDLGATVYWAVEDVAASIDEAVATGAIETEAAHEVGDDIVVGAVRSPQGCLIGFITNPHFRAAD